MKKVIPIILILILLAMPCLAFAAPAEFEGSTENIVSAMLLEGSTGQVLYETNQDERIYPASTTKLMTALLLVEQKGDSLDEQVTVGNEVNAFGAGASLMGLRQGETVTFEELLYGLLLPSGNDAASAIAVALSGNEDTFCEQMTARAKELGMENTQFVTACGMYMNQDEVNSIPEGRLGYNHYSTAADMSKLALEVLKHPEIMEVMQTPVYTMPPTNMHTEDEAPWVLQNSNLLLNTPETKPERAKYLYDGATGMKTGLVNNMVLDTETGEKIDSYGCLVASAERDGMSLVALVYGDTSGKSVEGEPESSRRWNVVTDLFDYGFENYAWADLTQYIEPVTAREQVASYADNDPEEGLLSISSVQVGDLPGRRMVDKATADGLADGSIALEQNVTYTKPFVAPISEGEEVGSVTYSLDGEEVYQAQLVAGRDVYAIGEEKQTSEEYGVPAVEMPEYWWLWLVIPGGIVGVLLIVRAAGSRTVRRTKRRRRGYYTATRNAGPMNEWRSELDASRSARDSDDWTKRKL